MKGRFVFVALFVLVAAYGSLAQQAAYADLLAKVKGGDMTIDFQAFRFAYADQPKLDAVIDDIKIRSAMVKALNDNKFKEAIKLAEELQKSIYIDMNSHIVSSMAYQGLGDAKKAKFHEGVYLGLVNSILKSGDGESPKTAYVVVSVAEEYVLLNALELKRGSQALVDADGHKYDLLTVTDAGGATVKLYFNIARVSAGYPKPTAK